MNPRARPPGPLLLFPLLGALALATLAQAPAEDAREREDALQRGQQQTSAAYRELQQAEFETKRADQDFRQLDADAKAVQKRADELKRQADAAKKKLDAAKAKEAQARKSYDAALNALDKISQPAPVKQ